MQSATSSDAEFGVKTYSSCLVSSLTKLLLMPAIVAIKKTIAPMAVRLTIANSMTNFFDGVFFISINCDSHAVKSASEGNEGFVNTSLCATSVCL